MGILTEERERVISEQWLNSVAMLLPGRNA
jgi:hypothetical protein